MLTETLHLRPDRLLPFLHAEEAFESGGTQHKPRGHFDADPRQFAQRATFASDRESIVKRNIGKPADISG
jgi:hypothetical protein